MGLRIQVFLLSFCFKFFIIAAVTNSEDAAVLKSLKDTWEGIPPNWVGSDPCGDRWEGIDCTQSRVTSIMLSNIGLTGTLVEDITALPELQTLDLSYNKDLKGSLPPAIGNLKKLTKLILVGCSFSGPIPDSIGSLQQLVFLSLSSNSFSGHIPASIGNLSKLLWLDVTDNQLEGLIPVSDGVSPGLDMLVHTQHFHFGKNQLSGRIPEKLFSSDMELIHAIFDSNQLTGPLPSSLGLVKTLIVVAMSNNSFETSNIPSWFATLRSLTRLVMERTGLQGEVPSDIFSLPDLQTVVLNHNSLNGTLDISTNSSSQLQSINMQNNVISDLKHGLGVNKDITILLADNPICQESGTTKRYCTVSDQSSSYTTPAKNCVPTSCTSNQISSPTCKCAYPYKGTIKFIAPSFSGVGNETYYQILEQSILESYQSSQLPVDSVSLSNPWKDPSQYLEISLALFPSGQDSFNRTGVSRIANAFSQPTYKPPSQFGPYYFFGERYSNFAG